jgi:hypothetical protein
VEGVVEGRELGFQVRVLLDEGEPVYGLLCDLVVDVVFDARIVGFIFLL